MSVDSPTFAQKEEKPSLIMLDQTYIIFDVDSNKNASETILIRKVSRDGLVTFRFQTNAPTRYIVKPRSGVLENNTPLPVNIILHGNRYKPSHVLLIQAVKIGSKEESKTVWEDINLEYDNVQTIRLKLGTTIVGIHRALGFEDTSAKIRAFISQTLQLSRKFGKGKVQELEDLLAMLTADRKILAHNIEQTIRLKDVIKIQLKQRNDLAADTESKISKLVEESNKLDEEITKNECELQEIYKNFSLEIPKTSS